jgi:hypothetical protein
MGKAEDLGGTSALARWFCDWLAKDKEREVEVVGKRRIYSIIISRYRH